MQLLNRLGTSFVLLGATSALARAQQELATLRGTSVDGEFGKAIAFVGDTDGDGHEDFAVGAPYAYGPNGAAGSVTLYSGRTTAPIATWFGQAANDRYGTSLAAAGDVDGDGYADVLVGAPHGIPWGPSAPGGYVEVRSGRTGAVLLTLQPPGSELSFGAALAGGQDVDGDGVPDFVVGVPGYPGSDGAAFVFRGSDGSLLRAHYPPQSGGSTQQGGVTLGFSVTFLGDITGDGVADYALGAPGAISQTASYVQLFDGATGDGIWRTTTGGLDEEFGWSLADIGDVTGDGLDDLVAGARQDGSFGFAFGRVRVLDGASGAIVASYGQGPGAAMNSGLGFDVIAVGDLDGDGRSEFAAGAPGDEPYANFLPPSHPARVWSLNAQAAMLTIPVPGNLFDAFGIALASGDANGDGLRDLLIGAPFDDQGGNATGSVHVYTFVRAPVVYCEAQVNSQGCTPHIASSGTPSASSLASFDVSASSVLNNVSGMLFYGYAPLANPHQGGTLCVRQPVHRTPVQSTGGNLGTLDCSGALTLDFNARIRSGIDPALVAGAEVYAQFWSRDPQGATTTNLTDALGFYVQP